MYYPPESSILRIDIITIHPGILEGPFSHSIIKRAQEKGLVTINLINLRDYSTDKHKKVDDAPYGGAAGMVIKIEPVANCINYLKGQCNYDEVIYLTPDGELFNQKIANNLSVLHNLILFCGHYKGIDERIREHLITREISIGDYVLSGGELPAAVVSDAIIRLIPGVISDETSALSDSFQDGLLAPPVYTRPFDFQGWKVPDVLLSGNEKDIEKWNHNKAIERTKNKRPNLLK